MTRGLILPTTSERRTLTATAARPQLVRADSDDAAPRFVGHGAVFDTRVLIGRLPWGFYEEFAPGSFTDTLADAGASLGIDQAMLIDHDSYYVVSRRSAETLRLAQDGTGLAVDSDLDTEVSYVRDLIANLRNSNITGMSIGFWVREDEWKVEEVDSDVGPIEVEIRRVIRADLLETSAVTFPAFPTTDAGLRDVAGALAARRDLDALARHAEHAPVLRELALRSVWWQREAARRPLDHRARYADALAARYQL